MTDSSCQACTCTQVRPRQVLSSAPTQTRPFASNILSTRVARKLFNSLSDVSSNSSADVPAEQPYRTTRRIRTPAAILLYYYYSLYNTRRGKYIDWPKISLQRPWRQTITSKHSIPPCCTAPPSTSRLLDPGVGPKRICASWCFVVVAFRRNGGCHFTVTQDPPLNRIVGYSISDKRRAT